MVSIDSTGVTDWEARSGERKSTGSPGRLAFSISETATQLGVSEASVWRAVKRGDLESIMFGGRRLITARGIAKALSAEAA
jgi:excisionase family DNA binding protein